MWCRAIAYNGAGIITVQRGNPDAFAPADDSVFVRMQQGYNPDVFVAGRGCLFRPGGGRIFS